MTYTPVQPIPRKFFFFVMMSNRGGVTYTPVQPILRQFFFFFFVMMFTRGGGTTPVQPILRQFFFCNDV